jgi:hypothetical protein
VKTRHLPLQQFAFLNKYLEGDNEEFLELIAPQIGFIVFDFNLLEERLTSFICQLINHNSDAKGLIITHNMTYSSKVDLFDRYLNHTHQVLNKQIQTHNKFVEDLKESGRLRNMVVHAEWDTADKEGYTCVKLRTTKNGLTQEFVQLDYNSLVDVRNKIIETYNYFDEYEELYDKLLYP